MMSRCHTLILVLLLLPCNMVLAAVQATISRAELYAGESFDLVVKVTGGESAKPDLSPLAADFDVINTQQSQVINIAGGQQRHENTWTITLIPKRTGTLQVPPLRVGQSTTSPQQVLVREAQAGAAGTASEDIFVEATAEPMQPYVQQHVLFTIRLYRGIDVSNASIDEPKAQPGVLRVEKLSDTAYTKQIQGRNYTVNELLYVLIPLQSGNLEVPATNFRGRTRQARGIVNVARRAPAVTIHVRPVPAAFPAGASWLPAKNVTVNGGWAGNATRGEVGTPLTYTISVRAENYLAHQLSFPPVEVPQGFRSYDETPTLDNQAAGKGFIGKYVRNTALIPEQPGNFTIPQLEVPWWNTDTDSLEYAKVAPASIEAVAGDKPVAQPAPVVSNELPPAIDSATVQTAEDTPKVVEKVLPWWLLLLSVVAITGWIITTLLWYRERHGRILKLEKLRYQYRQRVSRIKRDLEQACRQGEASMVRRLLLDWAELQFPGDSPTTISELERKIPELRQPLEVMNKCLYQKRPQQWRGRELWHIIDKVPPPKPPAQSLLEPLNRV